MIAFQHTERPALHVRDAPRWWSPLGEPEATEALRALGAQARRRQDGSVLWLLPTGPDGATPALTLEARAAPRGTFLQVGDADHGLARDFSRVVQGGLTVFAVCILGYAASQTSGTAFARAAVAVGSGWAVFMGCFAATRYWLRLVAKGDAALASAWGRVRLALFAQRS